MIAELSEFLFYLVHAGSGGKKRGILNNFGVITDVIRCSVNT